VKVFEGTTQLGADYATGDGDFAVSLVPLMSGQHVIHATAVDVFGNESASSATVSFGIQVIDEENPISGENGKFEIVGLDISPTVFVPESKSNSMHLALKVDAVKGLGGNSKNHRFFALTQRTILDPETKQPIKTIYAASEIDRDGQRTQKVEVSDEWDGTNEEGLRANDWTAYPSELSVAVVRLYAGSGQGPLPGFSPGEHLSVDQISEIMMVMTCINCPSFHPMFIDIVAVAYPFPTRFPPLVITFVWDPFGMCAPTCEDAKETCLLTNMNQVTGNPEQCEECFQVCDKLKKWPLNTGALGKCDYWDCSTFRFDNIVCSGPAECCAKKQCTWCCK